MADNNLTTKEEFLLNPVEEHNITDAAVASFETNLKHPLKVTVPITPQQDLHGMPNPYPAGASVNLIPDGTDTENGYIKGAYLKNDGSTVTDANWYISEYFRIDPSTTYTWSSRTATNPPSICFYDSEKVFISGISFNAVLSHTFIPPENTAYARSSQVTYVYQGKYPNGQAIQLEVGSTATEYRRYSNICPIEGFGGVKIREAGSNLLDINNLKSLGWSWDSSDPSYTGFIKSLQNRTYAQAGGLFLEKVNIVGQVTLLTRMRVGSRSNFVFEYSDGTSSESANIAATENQVFRYYRSLANKTLTCIRFTTVGGASSGGRISRIQVVRGAVSEFVDDPYPTTYPITFTDPSTGDPMTIYGGSLTLNEDGSADLVATRKSAVLNGTENFGVSYELYYLSSWHAELARTFISDRYCFFDKPVKSSGYHVLGRRAGDSLVVSPPNADVGYGNLSGFKAWLAENPIQIVGYLKTPITYHFSNVGQLKAFLGENNVWSDIGNVDVKYLTQHSETGLEYRGDRALELRRRAMMADAPTIHTTVGSEETGGLASFKSYVKAPVKKIEIPFSPKQDLHGYDNPWPAGGSTNIWDEETELGSINDDGEFVPATSRLRSKNLTEISPSTAYYLVTPIACVLFYYDENSTFISNEIVNARSFTTPENAKYLAFYMSTGYGATYKNNIAVNYPATVTTYSPYENICPIEGHDNCEVIDTNGPNLIPDDVDFVSGSWKPLDGVISASVYNAFCFRVPTGQLKWASDVGTTYVCLMDEPIRQGAKTYVVVLCSYRREYIFNNSVGHRYMAIFGLDTDGATAHEKVVNAGMSVSLLTSTPNPNLGKQTVLPLTFNQAGDHAFLPIQDGTGDPSPENVRPIHPGLTFTRDDDSVLSVYGGTLTVNADGTGSLSDEWSIKEFDGSSDENWTLGSVNRCNISVSPSAKFVRNSANYVRCNKFKQSSADNAANTATTNVAFVAYSNQLGFKIDSTYETADQYKAWLQENPITIAYTLATPITYTLSVAETNRALEALGLTQHIGPLYGGTITINPDGSADVEVTQGIINHIDDLWGYPYRSYRTGAIVVSDMSTMNGWVDGKCNIIKVKTTGSIGDEPQHEPTISWGWNDKRIYLWKIGILAEQCLGHAPTESEIIEWLNGMNFMCNYPLATPKTYHFSNLEQLKVWLGENNFWCDISDDITVKYWNRG